MSAVALDDSRLKPSRFEELWRKVALFGTAYIFCAVVGDHLSVRGSAFVTFWLPAGLYLAALLLNPTRDWPWLVLTALAANFVFDLLHGTKLLVTLFFFCANTVQALTGAWLVRKFVAERPTLATLKEFFGLLGFAAIFSTMLGATIGATTIVHFGFSHSFEPSWKTWWGSNAMAILVLTPFILVWFPKSNASGKTSSQPGKIVEVSVLFFGFSLYVWYLLASDKGIMSPNKALAIPFLLWAGLRFGPRGATAASLFFALTLAFFTTQFSIGLTPAQIAKGDYIFPLQTVLAMASLVALIPALVIGERNRTLAELRESEERFKNLSAAAFEGIFISENGRVLDANDQGLKMFGYERDEMIGRQIIELVTPEHRDSVAERIRAGQETIYGHQLLRKDGSIFPAEARAKTLHIGGRNVRMTALRDVTGRKRAEESLVQSEKRFSLMFKNSPLPVALIRLADGVILDVNESFLRMAGYTREEIIGHTALELNFYPDPGRRAFIMEQLHRHGRLHGHEQLFREKSGQIRSHLLWFDVVSIGGEPCTIVTALDITERKQAELEREASVAKEQQTRTEYTFQLIASQEAERTRIARELHDSLGQNLLLIKNRAQLEMAVKKLPKKLRGELQSISDIASQTIAEIRQISHDLHPPQLDILGLTRVLQSLIDSAGESSTIAIAGKFDSVDDVFLREAATNVYRIVQESLNNILKHSHAKKARVTLERDVHEVQLKIEDDGCGFKSSDGRRGLGLKNIAERVRMLGGKMKLDSQPDKGTRIEITIPISAESG
jgi:PAS domain S-box-containing protein